MTDIKNQSRRRILRSLVASGGAAASTKILPDSWIKPVVDAVSIPVHAGMSPFPTGFFEGGATVITSNDDSANSSQLIAVGSEENSGVLDYFFTPANAAPVAKCNPVNCSSAFDLVQLAFGIPNNPGVVEICLTDEGSNNYATSNIDGNMIDSVFGIGNSYDLTNMELNSGNVTGDIVRYDEYTCCGTFSAPLMPGMFSCINTTTSLDLSSPYKKHV